MNHISTQTLSRTPAASALSFPALEGQGLPRIPVNGKASLIKTPDELEGVIDVVLANYNGETHSGLGGRTPLEAIRYLLAKGEGGLVRTVSVARRSTLGLLQEARVVTIR